MNGLLRERFPILDTTTYLCSHSLGAVPRQTEEALAQYYHEWSHLGIKAWDGPWWAAVREFGSLIERILDAPAESVVPMQNVTRAMAAVASCFDYQKRRKIVIPSLEFTTTFPLWRGQERFGAELVIVESPDGVVVPTERILEAIDEDTLMVITSHAYFRSGALADLGALSAETRRRDVLLMVDGYQTVGSVPVSVRETPVDFFVGGSHKWLCGGPGAGYLYVAPERLEQLRPGLTGWFGLQDPFDYQLDTGAGQHHQGVWRFLGGTPNVPGIYAAREGIKTILEVGLRQIRQSSQRATEWLYGELQERGLGVKSPADWEKRNGMLCFDLEGAKEVRDELERRNVIVDYRPDCGIRVSPHFYNDRGDLERFLELLDAVRPVPAR